LESGFSSSGVESSRSQRTGVDVVGDKKNNGEGLPSGGVQEEQGTECQEEKKADQGDQPVAKFHGHGTHPMN
jgi:hypothetical protein